MSASNDWPVLTADVIKRRIQIGRERQARQRELRSAFRLRRLQMIADLQRETVPTILLSSSDDEL